MTLDSSKTIGGIGAILILIGVIPLFTYSTVISLVGAILIVIGLHGLSNYFKDRSIFNNGLTAFLVAVIGAAISAALIFTVVFANIVDILKQLYPGWNGDFSTLPNMTPNTTNFDPTTILPILTQVVVVFVVLWIFAIVAAFFLWRSVRTVKDKSTIGLFGTSGLLMLIGAILAIVVIGLILMWIAFLLLAIAFFQLKPTQAPPAETAYPPPPPQQTTV